MSETWYKLVKRENVIEKHVVDRVDELFVYVRGYGVPKRSELYEWFPAWEEAYSRMLDIVVNRRERAREEQDAAAKEIQRILDMKPPGAEEGAE